MNSSPRIYLPILCLVLLPFIAHLPDLLGLLIEDPAYRTAGPGVRGISWLLFGTPGWVDPNAGATTEALGHEAALQWLSGHIPWWNTYTGLGMPLAAEMQNSALFLPFILLLALPHGVILIKAALQVLTGLCAFGLGKSMKLSLPACIFMGILCEFSGTFAWFGHGPIMPLPFLPLLVWGGFNVANAVENKKRGGWLLVTLAIAGSILAGFPETAYMNGLLALAIITWRVFQSPRFYRKAIIFRILYGGILGLCLSAPAWLSFALSLPVSLVGMNADFGNAHFLSGSTALHFFPYLFGPPLFGAEQGRMDLVELWWHTGGYIDLGLLTLAALAFTIPSTSYSSLRYVLGAWLILTAMKAEGVHFVSKIIDLIPLIRQTMFFVYASPGWWFALTLLAAITIDSYSHRNTSKKSSIFLMSGIIFSAALLSLLYARHALTLQQHLPHANLLNYASTLWGFSILFLIVFVAISTKKKDVFLSSIGITNAVLLFCVPMLCGSRNAKIDYPALDWLKRETAFTRVVSFGTLPPNYGAYYGIKSINYTYLPVPRVFAETLDANIDPNIDPSGFYTPGLGQKYSDASSIHDMNLYLSASSPNTLSSLHWLSQHGVGLVAVSPEKNIWQDILLTHPVVGNAQAYDFTAGPLSGHIPAPRNKGAAVSKVGIAVGTFSGQATGKINVKLCSKDVCQSGTTSVDQTPDNTVIFIPLDQKLAITGPEDLSWSISVNGNDIKPAVWVWQNKENGEMSPMMPLQTEFDPPDYVKLSYQDPYITIWKLSNAAPYFSADNCHLTIHSTEKLEADCENKGTLVRQEIAYPGWHVTVNGVHTKTGATKDGLFQTANLVSGHNTITFSYSPPKGVLMLFLFIVGLLGTGIGFYRSRPISLH